VLQQYVIRLLVKIHLDSIVGLRGMIDAVKVFNISKKEKENTIWPKQNS